MIPSADDHHDQQVEEGAELCMSPRRRAGEMQTFAQMGSDGGSTSDRFARLASDSSNRDQDDAAGGPPSLFFDGGVGELLQEKSKTQTKKSHTTEKEQFLQAVCIQFFPEHATLGEPRELLLPVGQLGKKTKIFSDTPNPSDTWDSIRHTPMHGFSLAGEISRLTGIPADSVNVACSRVNTEGIKIDPVVMPSNAAGRVPRMAMQQLWWSTEAKEGANPNGAFAWCYPDVADLFYFKDMREPEPEPDLGVDMDSATLNWVNDDATSSCMVCLSPMVDPATLGCGHSACIGCLQMVTVQQHCDCPNPACNPAAVTRCPLCREPHEGPMAVNTVLRSLFEQLRRTDESWPAEALEARTQQAKVLVSNGRVEEARQAYRRAAAGTDCAETAAELRQIAVGLVVTEAVVPDAEIEADESDGEPDESDGESQVEAAFLVQRAENLQLMIDMMQRELEEVVRQQEHAENGAADVAQRQADPEAREPIGEAADVIALPEFVQLLTPVEPAGRQLSWAQIADPNSTRGRNYM